MQSAWADEGTIKPEITKDSVKESVESQTLTKLKESDVKQVDDSETKSFVSNLDRKQAVDDGKANAVDDGVVNKLKKLFKF